jgi:hypothetical protein
MQVSIAKIKLLLFQIWHKATIEEMIMFIR